MRGACAARVEVEDAVDPGRRRDVVVTVDHKVGRRFHGHAFDGAGGQLSQEPLALVAHEEAHPGDLAQDLTRQGGGHVA